MELQKLRKNLKEIEKNDGTKVLISYKKPVAIKRKDGFILVTERFFSKTTNEHISYWLQFHDAGNNYCVVSQNQIQHHAE